MPGRADAWTASTVRGRIQALPNPDMSDSSPPLVRVHGNLVNGQKACVRELMPSIFAPRSKLDERGCLDPKDDGQAPIGRRPSVSFFFFHCLRASEANQTGKEPRLRTPGGYSTLTSGLNGILAQLRSGGRFASCPINLVSPQPRLGFSAAQPSDISDRGSVIGRFPVPCPRM